PAVLVNASMLLYTLWLLLPAFQTTGRAATGALAVGLFGLGVLWGGDSPRKLLTDCLPRLLLMAVLPLLLWRFLHRGGDNFWGYYVQQAMFWFPLLWCAYVRAKGDRRMTRFVGAALLAALTVTTLTTIGWLIEGLLRGGRVYAYSRSLGSGEPNREAYLKELMLRNIGGYDFIYASVVAFPIVCWAAQRARGWKRTGFIALCAAQVVMIVLSQYTTAILLTGVLAALELIAALLRALRKGLSTGASLLWAAVPLLVLALLREPLIQWAADLCARIGFENAGTSLGQLLALMNGQDVESASRLETYLLPLQGFRQSPLVGAMFTGSPLLSQHSDLLDLFSGVGLLGTAAVLGAVWVMGRGGLRGLRRCPGKAQLTLAALALLAVAALGTVVYSRDIALVFCLGGWLMTDEQAA
ncbi:MAG: hypothetical protein PHY12_11930, partial [Eubacteriales bacterium]|nr:hypothetical protein [Eubacteriales bacterium]